MHLHENKYFSYCSRKSQLSKQCMYFLVIYSLHTFSLDLLCNMLKILSFISTSVSDHEDEEMGWKQLFTHQGEWISVSNYNLTLATEVQQPCYKKYTHPYKTPYTLKAKVLWNGLTGDPHCIQFIFLNSEMNYNIIASQPTIRKDPPTGVSQRSSLFPVRAW